MTISRWTKKTRVMSHHYGGYDALFLYSIPLRS